MVIGLISESNNIRRDLNESFNLMIVLLSPNNERIAFIFRLTCAVLSSPVSCRMIPRQQYDSTMSSGFPCKLKLMLE